MSDRFGPNTAAVEAVLARVKTLTKEEAEALGAVWHDAQGDALRIDACAAAERAATDVPIWWLLGEEAAVDAAWARHATTATWAVASDATIASWRATLNATRALVVRDLISREDFDLLTGPWRAVIGPTWDEVTT